MQGLGLLRERDDVIANTFESTMNLPEADGGATLDVG